MRRHARLRSVRPRGTTPSTPPTEQSADRDFRPSLHQGLEACPPFACDDIFSGQRGHVEEIDGRHQECERSELFVEGLIAQFLRLTLGYYSPSSLPLFGHFFRHRLRHANILTATPARTDLMHCHAADVFERDRDSDAWLRVLDGRVDDVAAVLDGDSVAGR